MSGVIRGNAAEPHELDLVREELPAVPVKSRLAAPGVGYLRVAEFGKSTGDQIKSEIASVTKAGAKSVIIDLRGTALLDITQITGQVKLSNGDTWTARSVDGTPIARGTRIAVSEIQGATALVRPVAE